MHFFMNVFKVIFKIILFFVLVAIGGMVAIQFADLNKHRDAIEASFKKATGFDMDIKGNVKAQLLPYLATQIEDIDLNVDMNGVDYKIEIGGINLKINLYALFNNVIDFDYFEFSDLKVSQDKNKQALFELKKVQGEMESTQDEVKFSNMLITHDTGTYHGRINFIMFGSHRKVSGKFEVDEMSIFPKNDKSNNASNSFFSLAGLSGLKGKIVLDAKKCFIKEIPFERSRFVFDFNKEKVVVTNTAKVFDGDYNAQVTLQHLSSAKPQSDFSIKIVKAKAAAMVQHFNPQLKVAGGLANFEFSGSAPLDKMSDYLNNLKAKAQFYLSDMDLLSTGKLSGSISDAVFNILSANKQDKLKCLAAKFSINNGVARSERGIGLESTHLMGLGSADIDLKSENLSMLIDFKSKNNSPINLGKFEGAVSVTGTISDPKVRVDNNMVKQGGSLALGFATSGISLLVESLVGMVQSDSSACERIMSGN